MITLKKNEIIYTNEIKENHEDYICKSVDSVVPYLMDPIRIDDDVTLMDFFNLIEKDQNLIEVVFSGQLGHFPIAPYIEEIKRDCPVESHEEIDYLELCWEIQQFDYALFYEKHKDDKDFKGSFGKLPLPTIDDKNEISIYVDVHGWGENEDKEIALYQSETHMAYDIAFTPLYRLKHLPIKLNYMFKVFSENMVEGEVIVEGRREFTVFDVFGAILSEISFCGLPYSRDEKWREISDDISEIKKGYEKDDEDED